MLALPCKKLVLLPICASIRRRGKTKTGLRKKGVWCPMSQLEPPTAPVGTPEVSKKKPFYKRKWFIALAILMLIGAFASDSESSETKTEKKVVTTTEANTPAAPNETVSESNARKKAASYLEYSAFSRSGLIEQLEYEGFTTAQAEYGVSTTGL